MHRNSYFCFLILYLMSSQASIVESKYYQQTDSLMCPSYKVTETSASSEIICGMMCERNFLTFQCRGFCFVFAEKTCKLYSLLDLGDSSTQLEWISIKNMKVTQNYTDSKATCSNEGQFLPLPTTADEEAGLKSLAKVTYRIGLDDFVTKKMFVTPEGEFPIHENWRPGQPNYLGGQNCVWAHSKDNYRWNDLDCTTLLTVICQHPKPQFCLQGEATVDASYEKATMACYKIRNVK